MGAGSGSMTLGQGGPEGLAHGIFKLMPNKAKEAEAAKKEAEAKALADAEAADKNRVNELNQLGAQGDRMQGGRYFDDLGARNRFAAKGGGTIRRNSLLGGNA